MQVLFFLLPVILCVMIIVANAKQGYVKACKIIKRAKTNLIKNLKSFRGREKRNSSKNIKGYKHYFEVLSLKHRLTKYLFGFSICMIIVFVFAEKLNVFSILLVFASFTLLFLGLASLIETGDKWTNDILKLGIIIIELLLISLMYALNIFVKDLEGYQFRFSFFIVMTIILIGALILSIYQVNTMSNFKLISFLIISLFSLIIVIIFYTYVGYGLIVLKTDNSEKLKNSVLNVKGFGSNGWRDIISIMYYGLSQVNSWQSLEIQNKNEMKPVITNNAIIIHLIANLFNLIYFSSIINALSKFIKRK